MLGYVMITEHMNKPKSVCDEKYIFVLRVDHLNSKENPWLAFSCSQCLCAFLSPSWALSHCHLE